MINLSFLKSAYIPLCMESSECHPMKSPKPPAGTHFHGTDSLKNNFQPIFVVQKLSSWIFLIIFSKLFQLFQILVVRREGRIHHEKMVVFPLRVKFYYLQKKKVKCIHSNQSTLFGKLKHNYLPSLVLPWMGLVNWDLNSLFCL